MSYLVENNIEVVFIDRDGTLGGDDTIQYPKDFELFPFANTAINLLKGRNVRVFSFTNQPGISYGVASKEAFIQELKGFGFDAVYICPHNQLQSCNCRKPKPGMLLNAAEDYQLDLTKCVVIGDNWTDIEAAYKVGATSILVKTGAGLEELNVRNKASQNIYPDYIADNLFDAVNWLLDSK